MTFTDFARSHGVLIDHDPPIGRWVRVKTTDKPQHRNGAAKFMGDHGFVQNHATMTEVAVWRPDGDAPKIDHQEIARRLKATALDIEKRQRQAAEKAEWILSQCKPEKHAYLASKGFADMLGLVWWPEAQNNLLVLPMYVDKRLVGCQLIDRTGAKKFLTGQRTSGAAFVIGQGRLNVLVEGWATGISAHAALGALKANCRVFVCFSAGNMAKIAMMVPKGLIVADNDLSGTGEKVAKETGWPYFMPPEVGQDFNDYHLATSLFRCSQALRAVIHATI